MLNSTLTAAKMHYQRSFYICHSFCICNLYFAAEEKTGNSGEKRYCLHSYEEVVRGCGGSLFPDLQHIFKLPDRTVPGGCDSWKHVRIGHDDLPAAICAAGRNLYRIYRTDTDLWSILRLCVGAFLIFMVDPMKALMFIVLFLVLQQIEGNLIYPHVVGNSVGLPSIWVLAAVSIGGSLMGVVGMLIFIPIVSVAYALFREIVYLSWKKTGV